MKSIKELIFKLYGIKTTKVKLNEPCKIVQINDKKFILVGKYQNTLKEV